MLIANTGQSLVVMNLRTGEQVQLPPGQMTPLDDSKISLIDDSFVLISLFNSGVLIAYTDAGAAYPGFPTTAIPEDSRSFPPVDSDFAANIVASASQSGGAGGARSIIQRGLNKGSAYIPGGITSLNECLLIGSDTVIQAAPGAVINNGGAVNNTMLRTGNAEFSSAQNGIPGVWIYCADEVARSGTGTLRYTHATTSLAWQAPGESFFGAEINIGSVVSAATTVMLTIPAATTGKALYVTVSPAALRNTNISRTVRLEPVTGARSVTWTRDTTTRTVTEAGHGRRIGDFVILFGASACEIFGYITAVSSNTWTIADTAGAGSGSSRAYGVRDIRIYAPGAKLDYQKGARTENNDSIRLFAIVLHAISDSEIDCPEVWNTYKYAYTLTGYKNVTVHNARIFRTLSIDTTQNSDGLHLLGPGRIMNARNIRAQCGDNAFAIGTGDVHNYVAHVPAYGDLSVEDSTVDGVYGENSETELVRLYTANSGWIRRTRIRNISGTVDPTTTAVVRVMTDTMSGTMVDAGATNVDGLEVDGCSARRSDGGEVRQVDLTGSGAMRNVRLFGVLWRPVGASVSENIRIDRSVDDVTFDVRHGDWDVCGGFIGLSGNARVKSLVCESVQVTRANAAASGGNLRPIVIYLTATNAQADSITVAGGSLIDISSTGNATDLIRTAGKKSNYSISGFKLSSTTPGTRRADALIRFDATAENGSLVTLSGCDNDATYGLAIDGGVPEVVTLSGYRQPGGNVLHGAVGSAATLRVGGSHVSVNSLLSATLTNISVDVRNALPCDGSRAVGVSGSLITNTNAGFGTGAGLYYHTGAAWTKVA